MKTTGTRGQGTEPNGDADESVVSRESRRESLETVALLLGTLVILLGLALAMGAPLPIGS